MAEIIVEPFTIGHYDEVYDLWANSPGVGLSGADTRDGIASYLKRNPSMSFVALSGRKVIGVILGGHDGRRGYIHHLAVNEPYRRQGVGTQLVEICLGALEGAGIQKCHLLIFHENEGGIAFWEAGGWTLRKDIIVMSRQLVKK
jgi:ribosomal protein S18 acetylase RimI-like enzyme